MMGFIKDEYGNDVDGDFTINDSLLVNLRYWTRYQTRDPFLNKELDALGLAAQRVLAARGYLNATGKRDRTFKSFETIRDLPTGDRRQVEPE